MGKKGTKPKKVLNACLALVVLNSIGVILLIGIVALE
jgi:hypothetical protein